MKVLHFLVLLLFAFNNGNKVDERIVASNHNNFNVTARHLQFENMFETTQLQKNKRKKGSKNMKSRSQSLTKTVDEILFDADRYHLWWTGPPPDSDFFKPAAWSASHDENANAIFTMAVIQGKDDKETCSSPNDLILFLGTARKVFHGDIVMALETDVLTIEMKNILIYYKTIVYLLPTNLCSKATNSIFCGSEEERVPASVFRYFFFEKWSAMYTSKSFFLVCDFRDIFFQSNPFDYFINEWYPEYQLTVYQEFFPNMVINRCFFNKRVMMECYGDENLKLFGNKVIISSGAFLGLYLVFFFFFIYFFVVLIFRT
jgi:hypothetical protein